MGAKSELDKSKFDSGLPLHPFLEGMLNHGHLGDQIGGFDQQGGGVASGDDDVLAFGAGGDGGENVSDCQIFVASSDIKLVQNDHAALGIG